MSDALQYDYWIVGGPKRQGIRWVIYKARSPQEPPVMINDGNRRRFTERFHTKQDGIEAMRRAQRYFPDVELRLIHVVNRRKKAEAQRDELLTLARRLVELDSGDLPQPLRDLIAEARIAVEGSKR